MLQIARHNNPATKTFAVQTDPSRRKSMSPIGPAVLAAALAALAFFGLAAKDGSWPAGLSAAAFALTAVLGVAWQTHARASRRLNAALDAYAREEIARTKRWKELARNPLSKVGKYYARKKDSPVGRPFQAVLGGPDGLERPSYVKNDHANVISADQPDTRRIRTGGMT
jgi:hypothetical protein